MINFKVYIINLQKDKNRKKNILNELKKQNLKNYKFISAVNGNKLKKKEINSLISKEKNFINPINTNMSKSEIGCSLSHIKIYKEIVKSDIDYALILEDDAFFLNKFTKNLKKFISINFKYKKQIILLSELREFYKIPIDKEKDYEIVDVTNAYFTHSYFINNEAARSLLHFNFPVKTVADNFIIFKIYCGIKITGLNPYLLSQDKKKFESSIKFTSKLKQVFLFKRFIYKSYNKILKKLNKFESHKG
tara:strand:+ start:446 stop:1189 length:744 start_codon:yes stop_codon:yes gene_type:complete